MSLGKVDDSHQCLYTSEILSPLLSANRGMAAGMKTPEIFGQPDANLAHCRYGQTGLARLTLKSKRNPAAAVNVHVIAR